MLFFSSTDSFTSIWRDVGWGSGDSKIAIDLRTLKQAQEPALSPVSQAEWETLVELALDGKGRFAPGQTRRGRTSINKEMRLLLLYFTMLRGIDAPSSAEKGTGVDHIIPEAQFEASAEGAEFRNRITNLALTPGLFNQRKSQHPLNDLPPAHRDWLVGKVAKYEQIPEADLGKYVKASDAPALHELRAEIYRETFTEFRNHFLEYLVPKS